MIQYIESLDFSSASKFLLTALVGLSLFVQISPIKINPWSWILNSIGSLLNKGVEDKVSSLSTDISGVKKDIEAVKEDIDSVKTDIDSVKQGFKEGLNSVRKKSDENMAIERRVRILRFGDEVRHEQLHSKEHYDQIIRDIDEYEAYCTQHPEFENDITEITIEIIKDRYKSNLLSDKFLDGKGKV